MNIQNDTETLCRRINELRNEYASQHTKSLFSSKQYKQECAKKVLNKFDIDTLLKSTIVTIPESHHIFFDYTIFKTYAVPELYETIIQYAIQKICICLEKYDMYEMHVNLNTFSISAFHRYKPILDLYSYECNTNYNHFHEKIKTMHIYNMPSTIETISNLIGAIMPQIVREKVVKYDKPSSEKAIHTISEIIRTTQSITQMIAKPDNSLETIESV